MIKLGVLEILIKLRENIMLYWFLKKILNYLYLFVMLGINVVNCFYRDCYLKIEIDFGICKIGI